MYNSSLHAWKQKFSSIVSTIRMEPSYISSNNWFQNIIWLIFKQQECWNSWDAICMDVMRSSYCLNLLDYQQYGILLRSSSIAVLDCKPSRKFYILMQLLIIMHDEYIYLQQRDSEALDKVAIVCKSISSVELHT